MYLNFQHLRLGYFYNYNGDDYCNQRTEISDQYLDENNIYKNEWGDKFN